MEDTQIIAENALDNEHFKTFFEYVIRVKSQGIHTPTF
jgi:hypothetical protein